MKSQELELLTAYIEDIVYFMKQMETDCAATYSQELSNPELQILMYLGKGSPRTMSEIAGHLSLRLSSLTAIVDKIVKKNFADRYRSDRDRRVVMAELTPEGKKAYDFHHQHKKSISERIFKALDDKERKQIVRLMKKVSTSVRGAD